MSSSKQLDLENLDWIEEAVLIGLAAYGELERLKNVVKVMECCKQQIPEGLRPVCVHSSADTVGKFAVALTVLRMDRVSLTEEVSA